MFKFIKKLFSTNKIKHNDIIYTFKKMPCVVSQDGIHINLK